MKLSNLIIVKLHRISSSIVLIMSAASEVSLVIESSLQHAHSPHTGLRGGPALNHRGVSTVISFVCGVASLHSVPVYTGPAHSQGQCTLVHCADWLLRKQGTILWKLHRICRAVFRQSGSSWLQCCPHSCYSPDNTCTFPNVTWVWTGPDDFWPCTCPNDTWRFPVPDHIRLISKIFAPFYVTIFWPLFYFSLTTQFFLCWPMLHSDWWMGRHIKIWKEIKLIHQ